jgi:serine/threonine-protein kinase
MDARTDIYSLGIIMYEMLTGRVPFEADTFMGVLTKHLYEEPIPPRRLVPPVDVSAVLESVLLKAIAKKPEKRYQSMNDLKQDLIAVKEGETPSIVYSQMRESAFSTVPPAPAEIVGGKRKTIESIDDEIPVRRSRLPILVGIVAVVLLGGIAGFFLFTKGQNEKRGVNSEKKAVIKPESETTDDKGAAESEPTTGEDRKRLAVRVTSQPENANIYKNGALIGELPLNLNRPGKSSPDTQYQIRLTGYKSQDIIITQSTPDIFKVALKKPTKSSAKDTKSTSSSSRRKKRKRKKKNRPTGGDLADPWAQ